MLYEHNRRKLRAEHHVPVVVAEPQIPTGNRLDQIEILEQPYEEPQIPDGAEQVPGDPPQEMPYDHMSHEWGMPWDEFDATVEEELASGDDGDTTGDNECKEFLPWEGFWDDFWEDFGWDDPPNDNEVPCDVTATDYCGNFIYENGKLKRILIPGGYVTFANDNINLPQYHFYITDHQGNIRVVAKAEGTIEQVNHYYPYGGLMGESTGSDTQPYKYNGKELDRHSGLDWYDYGARWYNGISWMTPDPLAEKYYDTSPYVYCLGNPVKYVDPDGKKIYVPKKYQPIVLEMINSFSKTQYKIDEKGFMYADDSTDKNEEGSAHYSERLDAIISAKGKLTIMIADKYTATNGKTSKVFDINKMGGGLTDATVKANVKTLVSERGHMVHDTEGNEVKKSSAEILIHEIVGHAAPALVGKETGNAVKNENIVRKELKLPEREDEEEHYE